MNNKSKTIRSMIRLSLFDIWLINQLIINRLQHSVNIVKNFLQTERKWKKSETSLFFWPGRTLKNYLFKTLFTDKICYHMTLALNVLMGNFRIKKSQKLSYDTSNSPLWTENFKFNHSRFMLDIF